MLEMALLIPELSLHNVVLKDAGKRLKWKESTLV